ncbi:hypothetical protein BH23PLA1_BH23PLA1_07120 [soil metagenome]
MSASSAARRLELAGASVLIFPDRESACEAAADRIAEVIRSATAGPSGRAVLGLATGSTPVPIYARLVEEHRQGRLSFAEVVTYNLDEYYPIGPCDPESYRSFMHRHLFSKVNLAPHRAHVLDGTVPEAFAAETCSAFDRWIEADGGLDLQLLGLGRNGHIGFNEPSEMPVEEALKRPTRLADLHPVTLADAAKDFVGGSAAVPRRALTMGIAPILAARSILVLAFGPHKSEAVARSLKGERTANVPGSLLQAAPGRVTWMLDPEAAEGLRQGTTK